jgi:DNA-directed RNA polymerase subunit M/transcription elongation factor TFIIS
MEEDFSDIIRKERESEAFCGLCGLEMTLVKGKRRKKYDKPSDVYVCTCGNRFRVRSLNELLRDIGERE